MPCDQQVPVFSTWNAAQIKKSRHNLRLNLVPNRQPAKICFATRTLLPKVHIYKKKQKVHNPVIRVLRTTHGNDTSKWCPTFFIHRTGRCSAHAFVLSNLLYAPLRRGRGGVVPEPDPSTVIDGIVFDINAFTYSVHILNDKSLTIADITNMPLS